MTDVVLLPVIGANVLEPDLKHSLREAGFLRKKHQFVGGRVLVNGEKRSHCLQLRRLERGSIAFLSDLSAGRRIRTGAGAV